ncbi:hypothetical protein Tco_0610156 [Tanacetum coccineum]
MFRKYILIKPYLDAQEAKDIYEVINREYSPIPTPTHHDIGNLDDLCRTEEFTVVRHSIGDDEEFVTVGPTKINNVERTPGNIPCIYHELFNRKDRGWEEPYGRDRNCTSEDIMDIIDICLCSSREDEERGTRGVKLRAETYSWGLTIGEEQCLVVHGGITQSQPRRYGVLIERSCAHTTQEDDRGVLDSIALCGRVDNLIARGVGSRSWGSVIPEANTVHYIVRSGTGSRGYGYIKNHKKTVKNGQARTRESEEYKKKPKIQSRSQKSQASVKSSQKWALQQNGKDKVVISKALTSSLSSSSHVEMEKAHKGMGFALDPLTKEAQAVTSRNDSLAILEYHIEEYTDDIVHDFERRLETIWDKSVNRVHILDFEGLTPEMRRDLAVRLRMVYTGEDRKQFILASGLHTEQEMAQDGFRAYWTQSERIVPDKGDFRDYWIKISSDRDFLGPAPSYVHIKDPVRRLCHKMIACTISGRGQGPKKVTGIDLFYLRSMDRRTANVPYLLAQYLFRNSEGRKSGARLSGGHFIGHLAEHFGLVSDEGLREGPPPPPPAPQPRTMSQRIKRIEEDMRDLQNDVVGLLGVVESFTTEKSRVSTWLISCMTQLMDASGHPYHAFDSTLVGSLRMPYQRRVRPRTRDASTFAAPHADDQPDPCSLSPLIIIFCGSVLYITLMKL